MEKENLANSVREASRLGQNILENILSAVERHGRSSDILEMLARPNSCPVPFIDQLIKRMADGREVVAHLRLCIEPVSMRELLTKAPLDMIDPTINETGFSPEPDRAAAYSIWLRLIRYDQAKTTGQVKNDIADQRMRSLTLREQLAFAIQYPDFQRESTIVALGSECRDAFGHDCVPCLGRGKKDRVLRLRYIGELWTRDHLFGITERITAHKQGHA